MRWPDLIIAGGRWRSFERFTIFTGIIITAKEIALAFSIL